MRKKLLSLIVSGGLLFEFFGLMSFNNPSKTIADGTSVDGALVNISTGTVTKEGNEYCYSINQDAYYWTAVECLLPLTDYTLYEKSVFVMDNTGYAPGLSANDRDTYKSFTYRPFEKSLNGVCKLICTVSENILHMSLRFPDSTYINKDVEDSDIINGTKSASFFYREAETTDCVKVKFAPNGAYAERTKDWGDNYSGHASVTVNGGMYVYDQDSIAGYLKYSKAYLPLIDFSDGKSHNFGLVQINGPYDARIDTIGYGDEYGHSSGLTRLTITNKGENNLSVSLKKEDDKTSYETVVFTSSDIYNGYESLYFQIRQTGVKSYYQLIDLDELESIRTVMSLGYKYDKDGENIVNDDFRLKIGAETKLGDFAGTCTFGVDVTCSGTTIECELPHEDTTYNIDYLVIDIGAAYTDGHMNSEFTANGFVKVQYYGTNTDDKTDDLYVKLYCSSKTYSVSGMIDYYYVDLEESAVSDLYNIIHA